jgi:ATP-binding cassette subfamily C (CFTR/MRP) protein 1
VILQLPLLMYFAEKPGSGKSLALAALRCFRGPLLFAALPRVCLIVLEFCQPFLITYAIKYVTQATVETFGVDIGYQLILASIFIYTGLAVSLLASPRVQSLIDLRLPQHRTSIVSIVYAQCSEVLWSRLSTRAA